MDGGLGVASQGPGAMGRRRQERTWPWWPGGRGRTLSLLCPSCLQLPGASLLEVEGVDPQAAGPKAALVGPRWGRCSSRQKTDAWRRSLRLCGGRRLSQNITDVSAALPCASPGMAWGELDARDTKHPGWRNTQGERAQHPGAAPRLGSTCCSPAVSSSGSLSWELSAVGQGCDRVGSCTIPTGRGDRGAHVLPTAPSARQNPHLGALLPRAGRPPRT